jgi:A/G-specific adenine glycosylase
MNPDAHVNGRSREEVFRRLLLAWYDVHARDLPWRQDQDAYRVWVSEIMLQQTRVTAVIEHYHEFLRRFPTVEKLAAARESSVLAAWSGLGYYRRARMLHRAAKLVVRELGGELPTTAEGLRALSGVGRYTAAAIASIAFGEPTAVVDGNVERVLQRFSGKRIPTEQAWRLAEVVLDRKRPGDFNQAMMELGATLCTPRTPLCLSCPVVELCASRGELTMAAKSLPQKKREIHYALDLRDEGVFLVRRPRNARLMAGMWELPELERSLSPTPKRQHRFTGEDHNGGVQGRGNARAQSGPLFTVRHAITTTDYTVHVWRMTRPRGAAGKRTALEQLPRIALTGLARKILRKVQDLPLPPGCGPRIKF